MLLRSVERGAPHSPIQSANGQNSKDYISFYTTHLRSRAWWLL